MDHLWANVGIGVTVLVWLCVAVAFWRLLAVQDASYDANHESWNRGERGQIRNCGLACPLDPYQVAALAVIIYLQFGFYTVCWPCMGGNAAATTFWVHVALTACMVLLWLRMTFVDPARPSVMQPTPAEGPALDDTTGKHYCNKCKAIYNGAKRKHCVICNKCTQGFDHHCFFLNVDVAQDNYVFFCLLSLITLALVTFQLVAQSLAAYVYFTKMDGSTLGDIVAYQYSSLQERVDSVLGHVAFLFWLLPMIVIAAFTVLCLFLLVLLHAYLIAIRTTTYSWKGRKYADEPEELADSDDDKQPLSPRQPPPADEIICQMNPGRDMTMLSSLSSSPVRSPRRSAQSPQNIILNPLHSPSRLAGKQLPPRSLPSKALLKEETRPLGRTGGVAVAGGVLDI